MCLMISIYYIFQIPRLFDGCEFFFSGTFDPPHPTKEDLVRLVKMAGGTLVNREPRSSVCSSAMCPYHAKPGSPLCACPVVIVSGSSTYPTKEHSTTFQVPPTWIFDCLSHFQLKDTQI